MRDKEGRGVRDGDILWVNKERTQRGKCETQDEMEFLSVGLDKQPQFCSCDRSQPKRRRRLRRDARFSTLCNESFLSSLAVIFSARCSLFRLERNFSSTSPPRFISCYITSFIAIESIESSFIFLIFSSSYVFVLLILHHC